MSTIDITRNHKLNIDDAKKRAEEFAKSMETKLGLSWKWSGNTILFEAPAGAAKGTKGEVTVTDRSVRVQIDLPLLLRVLKGTVESKVNEKLNALL